MRTATLLAALALLAAPGTLRAGPREPALPYPIVDTGQVRCYDARREIAYPAPGEPFSGQDAQVAGNGPRYRDEGDGTVTDLVTGLMWQRDPGEKRTLEQARAGVARYRLGGHDDWRLPTIKELDSLVLFSGTDPDPRSRDGSGLTPFLDTRFFRFEYGDPSRGERIIDSQFATSTIYRGTTMGGARTMFGVNFADGRIKGYPVEDPRRGGGKLFHVLHVRGNPRYGINDFHDEGDGTVLDRATGLVWMKVDSGALDAGPDGDGRMDWRAALAFAEGLEYAGRSDWRLPDAKELQSIVDYARCPAATRSAAIDPVFGATPIRREDGAKGYGFYWTSTTHASRSGGETAAYVAFGEAPGWMRDRRLGSGVYRYVDVHGAGAQRSDPKAGDASAFPHGRGPQGDVIRIRNLVRCVRGGTATPRRRGPAIRATPERPGESGSPRPGFVRRLDRDGDGKVSREEFDGPPAHFRDFDRNGDGFIDADEAPAGPPPGRRR